MSTIREQFEDGDRFGGAGAAGERIMRTTLRGV